MCRRVSLEQEDRLLALVQRGAELQNAGLLAEAEEAYASVLAVEPEHADAREPAHDLFAHV